MSARPRLLKKQSSLAILVEQERERCESPSRPPSEIDLRTASEEEVQEDLDEEVSEVVEVPAEEDKEGELGLQNQGDIDGEGGDTDAALSSEDENESTESEPKSKTRVSALGGDINVLEEIAPPVRMSRRLMSMKRRGKIRPLVDLTEEFEFCADDCLTVRGEENDFYVCRVLEDVPETATSFRVAWFNRVEENLYEVSFDDVCHMDSVITRVALFEVQSGKFSINKLHIKQTKRLLREALSAEAGDTVGDKTADEESESEDEQEEEEEEDEPPAKRTRRGSKSAAAAPPKKGRRGQKKPAATPKKSPGQKRKQAEPKTKKKQKAVDKDKPRRPGVLIPNNDIEQLDVDPIFEAREDMPMMPVLRPIKAVILNDLEMLKDAIEDREEVYSVHWPRSPEVNFAAIHYALLNQNHEAIKLLLQELNKPKETPRKNQPTISLGRMDTGMYNFYTFGHAVRELYASRGSREGNNAFLDDKNGLHGDRDYDNSALVEFCFKRGVPLETVKFLLNEFTVSDDSDPHEEKQNAISSVWLAIRSGNRKLAGYLVSKGVDKTGFGFNFLHKEVLLNDNEDLSNFRSPSVKKKPVENKTILPIHAACINPNGDYLKTLLNSVPEHSIPDRDGYKPIHYAAACEGAGPLKVLLSRGADPNDPAPKAITPLMIAAKYGREEVVKELVSLEDQTLEADEDEVEKKAPKVVLNFKNKKTLAAIHYAARRGHVSTIKLLVAGGAMVDLQTGSYRGNVTALMIAAAKGHLDVVKTLLDLKASPDKRGKWKKTALMYAVKNGHSPIAAHLLRIGVDPCAADTSGNTPVHYAAAYGWLHCLKMLIKAGADPNAANQWKVTPLAIALMKDHMPCADYLLSLEKVDVNFPDDSGRTLLCQKLRCSTLNESLLEKVTYLVEKKGADVNKPDVEGWTPLHFLAASSIYEKQNYDRELCYTPPPLLVTSLADVSRELARLFVSAGANADAVNNEGQTPVMVAILQNNFPLIDALLELGAKGSAGKDSRGCQVLHIQAGKADSLDLSNLYPEATVVLAGNESEQLEQQQKHLKSLVMRACNEMMEKLIAGGAEINCVQSDGLTPAMVALSKGNMDQFSMLLDHGVDPSIGQEQTGRNLLHLLATRCSGHDLRGYMKTILKKTSVEKLQKMARHVDNNGFTPLLQACETIASSPPNKDHNEFVKEFIKILIDKCGSNVEAVVGEINRGKNRVVRSAERFGLSIREREDNDLGDKKHEAEYGETGLFSCLHFLVYRSWNLCPFLELLLEYVKGKSSVIDSFDRHGRTPLQLAVKWLNSEAAKLVIKGGADVNLPSQNDINDGLATALIMAARPGSSSLDTLQNLLAAKAEPNKVDKYGRTALSWAVTNSPDSSSTPFKLCKALLEAGADVNTVDKKQRSPLHYSVNSTTGGFETLTEVEDLLIKYGADTTAVDFHGRIPLHYAFVKMKNRHADYSLSDPISVAGLLCEAMAEQGKDLNKELNRQDNFGQTPLHRAALRGATICALNLLQKGASLEVKDNDDNSPFSLALRENHQGCAMMFMQNKAPASCQVIKLVIPSDKDKYEDEKKKKLWVWKNVVDLKEPKPDIRAAFRVVVEKNWQGIAYLMLEVAGLDFMEAIQATLESNKLDLVWTLLRKQRKDAPVQKVDKKGRNLLHLLAIHALKQWNQVVEKIASHLVQRGVPAGGTDLQGAAPLHYAACNHNLAFCRFLYGHSPSSVDVSDVDGVTPFAAVFSNSERGSITLVEFFLSPKFCNVKNLDICYSVRETSVEREKDTTTPLIEAALSSNEKIVIDLLKHGASVNFPKQNGRTALMEVVRNNMVDMVKVLMFATDDRKLWTSQTTTNVDLTAQDSDGKSVIHHCVKNRTYGSAENVDLLRFLASFKAPLDLRDSEGHTPLFYAKQQASGIMSAALVELLGTTEAEKDTEEPMEYDTGFNFVTSNEEYWEGQPPDAAADAEVELEEARKLDKPVDELRVEVDSAFRMEGGGEVYIDPETDVPYDILMAKVDVKYGMFGLNNFYKMQIIHHKAKDLWVLFNRWGRVGDNGQHQRTPYSDPKEATSEFKKIFKSKTGNEWEKKDSFQKQPKKYALVLPERNPEKQRKKAGEVLKPFDLKKCVQSRLTKGLQSFMETITDFETLSGALDRGSLMFDREYMPFGRLSTETIEKARQVLWQIKAIVDTIDRRNLEGTEEKFEKVGPFACPTIQVSLSVRGSDWDGFIVITYEVYQGSLGRMIAELSNEYYMLVPLASYTYERIPPLNDNSKIENHLDALYNLTELAAASKIMLGAQHRSKDVNPLDYVYKSLGCHLELLDPDSDECQLILEYIHNSRGRYSPLIEGIFRVSRPKEAKRMRDCGVPGNHRLLWHGTCTSNLIGILKQGLRIAPPEAPRSGWTLGKGIYTSDSFQKSAGYINYGRGNSGFLLLCEVALGNVKEVTSRDFFESAPEGFDSVMLVSKQVPDPSENVTTPYGVVIPAGVRINLPNLQEKYNCGYYFSNSFHEFVVYKESQVQIRYAVKMKRPSRYYY